MMGTRFSAATESLTHEQVRLRLVATRAADTVQTRVFDIVRGYAS
jgi:NAD(P)H-dependent flavin oxidoreductase YrpB (nitropropane dioxygenase family)